MNLFYLKDYKMQLFISIMESNRTKDLWLQKTQSNKDDTVSLTKFYYFLKLCSHKLLRKN